MAVVILHVYKTWNWLLLNLSREGYMRSMEWQGSIWSLMEFLSVPDKSCKNLKVENWKKRPSPECKNIYTYRRITVAMFVNLGVRDFYLPSSPTALTLFRSTVTFSDKSRWYHVVCKSSVLHSSVIALLTLSPVISFIKCDLLSHFIQWDFVCII